MQSGELAQRLREFINESDETRLIYLNMDAGRKRVFEQETYTVEDVRKIVAKIRDGSIKEECKGLKDK